MKDLSTPVLEKPEVSRPPLPQSQRVASAQAPALVYREQLWRQPPDADALQARRPDSIVISRWACDGDEEVSVAHEGAPDHHCISLALRSGSIRFLCAGMPVFDGRVTAGAVQVTAPGVAARAVFTSACDVLHLFVPQAVLAACYEDQFGHAHPGELLLDDPFIHNDPALERLGQALAVAHAQDAGLGRMFADSVALAIVARVVASHFQRVATNHRAQTALPQWRLRRAIAFIDENLAAPIGLADIAGSTGLTRMYFAAQFRRATGMRPHEYLVRRRIEHAQDLLRSGQGSVLEVAMRSGFRSQAHFTTVFKRFVGDTPYCWRVKVTSTQGSNHV
ncbi:helix-turn-helix transcriptional regulator [Cupriavidus agavae]|uniref:AraC-like DNA-binding protein n=1 Tax=Cupriavidus agavae TaxID=1001822 RepID=A0A4Q7S3Y0_9BURK|nr:AraC family transcriptional regulator [Cupriavidus agavae]RZT39512.1 AraC-like DNA-binding protein [Cupriavidus agavae]